MGTKSGEYKLFPEWEEEGGGDKNKIFKKKYTQLVYTFLKFTTFIFQLFKH